MYEILLMILGRAKYFQTKKILKLKVFYQSTLVSVWMYSLMCRGGNVSKSEKRRIDSIVRIAERVTYEYRLLMD